MWLLKTDNGELGVNWQAGCINWIQHGRVDITVGYNSLTKDKSALEDLKCFLEFQQRKTLYPTLQFNFMRPKIYINTTQITFDLNDPKDSLKNDKAVQTGRTSKSLTLEIHHGGCFTPIPSRSYVGGQVSSFNVDDIDEFCLHDLKDMVVKLGYGLADLMYYHFLIPRLGLDYGMHPLNVDADVLEMAKYVKDYKIILVYVEHGSSIFVTPNKGVSIVVDNHLRKGPIEIDSSPDVNKNLTSMCHRNLTKEWEQVRSKSLSIGEVIKNLSKKQPSSSVEAPIVVECAKDPFEELDNILGDYAHTGKQITGNEITEKQMVVHVGNNSTVDDVLELEMLFETEMVCLVGKFKEVEVDADNESKEESDTEGDYTSGSDSENLDYDPKHDEVFDDDEHIVKDVHVSMNNFCFTIDPKHDISIGVVEVQEDDPDVIDYDSFSNDLADGIDSRMRIKHKELRRIGKHKNKERVRVKFQGTIQALVPYVVTQTDMSKNGISQTKGGPVIRDNNISVKLNILGKDKACQGKGRWEVRTLIEDHNCLQSREIKACTSRFLSDHIIKSLATNLDIPVRAVQDQIQKQFDVEVSKMKAFRAKRIATDKIIGNYKEQYSLLREYAQELINQNPGTTVRIDVQQEPNSESMTRTFRRVQIVTAVGVDAKNVIYPVAYAIVETESKASWCWFLNLLGEDLGTYTSHSKATSIGEFNKKMVELKSFNSDAYD
ncbi:hypothetical protein Tco_0855098 [Tanacetum coccineum]